MDMGSFAVPQLLLDIPNCHVVGGAVRDALIGRPSSDVDLATSLTPDEVIEYLETHGVRALPTGYEYGTITALTDEGAYEITTFRKDMLTNGRHAVVEFSQDIEDDLSRRDFTINAIAVKARTGEVIDPYEGQLDIQQQILRTVGPPSARFSEDYLRVLRAARFAGRYNFTIYPDTLHAMKDFARHTLNRVSKERIAMEFDKAFEDEDVTSFLMILMDIGFLGEKFIPYDLTHENQMRILRLFARIEPEHRWNALAITSSLPLAFRSNGSNGELGTGEVAKRLALEWELYARYATDVADYLKLSNDRRMSFYMVTRYYLFPFKLMRVSEADRIIGTRFFQNSVGRYLNEVAAISYAVAAQLGYELDPRIFIPDPLAHPVLTGQDLIDAGLTPGPRFGVLLEHAHHYQMRHAITDREELLRVALEHNESLTKEAA